MSDNNLCFRAVTIRRLYGADHNIVIDGLCKGVNVIYGANATGKTTLAVTMGGVLWPATCVKFNPIIHAQFDYGESAWNAVLEGSYSRYQRDGAPSAPPPLPPSEQHSRYYLSLQDMLGVVDGQSDFAAAIIEEMAGGINVEKAAEALGFEIRPLRANKLTEAARSTRAAWKAAEDKHKRLDAERRSLEDLEAQKDNADRAAMHAAALEKALEVYAARQEHEEAERAVSVFPKQMHVVRPEDAEDLKNYDGKTAQAEEDERQAEEELRLAQSEMEATFLPESGLPDGLLATLRKSIDKLHELESSREATETELARAKREEEKAWTSLQVGWDRENTDGLDLPALNELEQVFSPVAGLRAELRSRDRLGELVGDGREDEDADIFREGLVALHRWLQLSGGEKRSGRPSRAVIMISALIFIAAIAIAIQSAGLLLILSLVLALLSIGVIIIEWQGASFSEQKSEKVTRRRDFERLNLTAPVDWTTEEVRKRSDELLEQWRAAALAEEKKSAWRRWEKEWDEVEKKLSGAQDALADHARRMGLDHEVLTENGLFWFVKRLADWQHKHEGVAGLLTKQERITLRIGEHLDAINEMLASYDIDAVAASPEANGAYSKLEQAEHDLEMAQERVKQAGNLIEQAQRAAKDAMESRSNLLQRLELTEEEKHAVVDLCNNLEAFRDAVKRRGESRTTFETKRQDLRRLPGFEPSIEELTELELQGQFEAAEREANERGRIVEEITEIKLRIRQAEQGHEVEASRARYDDALEMLARDREREYEKVAGRVLADFVQEEAHERAESPVYKWAQKIFRDITRGRYTLDLGPDSSFRATDSHDNIGRALSELSSGTKIQLLLAVRVAFVEEAETGCKLPLILDETLATSDDDRTPIIIDAIRTVANSGRQIIYLTAQSDEVHKWRRAFDGEKCEFKVTPMIDSAVREALPVNGSVVLPQRVAVPDDQDLEGISHEEYGALISVPKWSPRENIGRMHLWYLVEDVPVVHALLKEGIMTWGSLQNLHGGGRLSDDAFSRSAAFAKAGGAWSEAWHIGRGKLVDRLVLEAADGVTDTKIDEVALLCEEVDGDARELVTRLRNGAVSRFLSGKTDELESYFRDNGYIDPLRRLTREEQWARVRVAVADDIAQGVISTDDLERLFERLE